MVFSRGTLLSKNQSFSRWKPGMLPKWKDVPTCYAFYTDQLENSSSMPFLLSSWLVDEAFQDQFRGHNKYRIDIEQKQLLK